MAAHHEHSRRIRERIHISGQLVLLTPAHFGNGEVRGDALVDMTLLLDEVGGKALIPGTTIAGALRNYLRERLHGYQGEERDSKESPIAWLFGPKRDGKEVVNQSLLIVDDALAQSQGTTLRDGVRIDPKTATAYVEKSQDPEGNLRTEGAKFDIEVLQAGTTFDLHFELALTERRTGETVLPYLAAALQGLENGQIRLGARKRRGYGRCQVENWAVSHYNLTEPGDLCAWLETPTTAHRPDANTGKIASALKVSADTRDERSQFAIHSTFNLDDSSLLIRSGFGRADAGPDMEHLHAVNKDGNRLPVIPGTSWGGVIRHRALRIAKTIADDDESAEMRAGCIVSRLFGWMPERENDQRSHSTSTKKPGEASKVTFDETIIMNGQSLYQTRVRIDRFTGGAFETALFEQAPVYGKHNTTVGFHVQVRDPSSSEMGLLLLVLKDLWTGDLPVGGEASVGRGRLQGIKATVDTPDESRFQLRQGEEMLGLTTTQQETLQGYVDALWTEITGAQEADNE